MATPKIIIIALACLLVGCSSSSGDPVPPDPAPPGPLSAAGMWQGTAQADEPSDVQCIVSNDDEFACLLFHPETAILTSLLHGEISAEDGSPAGSGVMHWNACCPFSNADKRRDFAITGGELNERDTFVLDISIDDDSMQLSTSYDPLYEDATPVEELTGVYGATIVDGRFDGFSNAHTDGLVVDPDGSYFLQYGPFACVHSGSIDVPAEANSYRVGMQLDGCLNLSGDYSGLGFVEGDQLKLVVFNEWEWVTIVATRPN